MNPTAGHNTTEKTEGSSGQGPKLPGVRPSADPWRDIWEEKFLKEKRLVAKRHEFLNQCSYGFTSAIIRQMARHVYYPAGTAGDGLIIREGQLTEREDCLFILDEGDVE